MRILYKNINPTKLHDELIASGITPELVESDCPGGQFTAPNTWITVDESQAEIVNAVVAVHDPTPLPLQPTENEMLRDYVLDIDYRLIMMELGL